MLKVKQIDQTKSNPQTAKRTILYFHELTTYNRKREKSLK